MRPRGRGFGCIGVGRSRVLSALYRQNATGGRRLLSSIPQRRSRREPAHPASARRRTGRSTSSRANRPFASTPLSVVALKAATGLRSVVESIRFGHVVRVHRRGLAHGDAPASAGPRETLAAGQDHLAPRQNRLRPSPHRSACEGIVAGRVVQVVLAEGHRPLGVPYGDVGVGADLDPPFVVRPKISAGAVDVSSTNFSAPSRPPLDHRVEHQRQAQFQARQCRSRCGGRARSGHGRTCRMRPIDRARGPTRRPEASRFRCPSQRAS